MTGSDAPSWSLRCRARGHRLRDGMRRRRTEVHVTRFHLGDADRARHDRGRAAAARRWPRASNSRPMPPRSALSWPAAATPTPRRARRSRARSRRSASTATARRGRRSRSPVTHRPRRRQLTAAWRRRARRRRRLPDRQAQAQRDARHRAVGADQAPRATAPSSGKAARRPRRRPRRPTAQPVTAGRQAGARAVHGASPASRAALSRSNDA